MCEVIMKTLLVILSAAALGGCAVPPPGPANYGTRLPPPADPSQWHVVSVTPVPPGTGERVAASSGTGSSVQYSYEPAPRTVYAPQPAYVAPPVYGAPYYAPAPSYYYPPVSIGLDLMFGRSWGGGKHGHRGHRGHRNWGGVGVGIGSRW